VWSNNQTGVALLIATPNNLTTNTERMFHVKQLSLRSVDVGCDYITLTAVGEPLCEILFSYAQLIEQELLEEGAIGKEWRAMGYRGFQIGPMRYGARKGDEGILMVSGEDSKTFAPLFKKTDLNITRVDYQVTIELKPPNPAFVYDWYKLFDSSKSVDPTTPYYKYISSPTGDTLYVNKRSGSTQLRMYDKSNDFNASQLGTFIRFEVEYKRQSAEFAYRRWATEEEQGDWVCSIVAAEFKRRGINVVFDDIVAGNAIEKGQIVSTLDGTIGWLERCVSPVIMRLIDAGYKDEVYAVLRLKDLF
jgi:hypothetical protein